jgi:hypothetical protein
MSFLAPPHARVASDQAVAATKLFFGERSIEGFFNTIDPLLPFEIGHVNEREARESGLWPRAWVAWPRSSENRPATYKFDGQPNDLNRLLSIIGFDSSCAIRFGHCKTWRGFRCVGRSLRTQLARRSTERS